MIIPIRNNCIIRVIKQYSLTKIQGPAVANQKTYTILNRFEIALRSEREYLRQWPFSIINFKESLIIEKRYVTQKPGLKFLLNVLYY